MIAPALRPTPRAGLLAAGLALALALRLALAGEAGNTSAPAGALFGAALLALAAAAGWRPALPSLRGLLMGAFGAAVLVGLPFLMREAAPVGTDFPPSAFPLWAGVVTLVAVGEEVLLRGALFALVSRARGTLTALALTSAAFALIHVPLYGPAALPLDLAVGLWLGALRVATGGVTAPAAAHCLADLATWWLA